MVQNTLDHTIREEIETVAARKIILDQLEGGLKTGAELREAIAKHAKARMLAEGVSSKKVAKYEVTSPKLYHNTKKLEDLGVIVSWKQSQYRLFELEPRAVHPVRRVLGITKPLMYVTSLSKPEDQRPFVQWLAGNPHFNPKQLLVFVEARHWTRGVSRIVDRFIPDEAFRRWTTEWREVPDDLTGTDEEREYGNLQETCDFIENTILSYLPTHDMVFDLTVGPTLIALALSKLATEYSIPAFHATRYNTEESEISYF
jgi:hypothetical protein